MLLYLIKLPESVRWAWAVGKMKTAKEVIENVANFNKAEVPPEFFQDEATETDNEIKDVGVNALVKCAPLRSRYSFSNIFWLLSSVLLSALLEFQAPGYGIQLDRSHPLLLWTKLECWHWFKRVHVVYNRCLHGDTSLPILRIRKWCSKVA